MLQIELTDEQINAIIEWTYEIPEGKKTRWSGMTYEQGVRAMLDVITGESTVSELLE